MSRYNQVMQLMDEENNPFSAPELVHMILYPTSKTLYLAEQIGLLRLLRGYSQAASLDEMVAFPNGWILFLD